jgi:hypothetical protein
LIYFRASSLTAGGYFESLRVNNVDDRRFAIDDWKSQIGNLKCFLSGAELPEPGNFAPPTLGHKALRNLSHRAAGT